jgi:hypothetical protein
MMRQVYFREGLCAVFLGAYAIAAFVPLASLAKDCDSSLARMKARAYFIASYKKETPPFLLLRNVDGAQALRELEKLSQETGMVLENARLDKEENFRGPDYKALPLSLSLSGPEAGLMKFLGGIKKMGFACRLVCLRVEANLLKEEGVRAQMQLEKIECARCASFDPHRIVFKRSQAIEASQGLAEERKLFKNPGPGPAKNISAASGGRPDIMQDLSLVGIVEDEERQAVLEDKKTHKTIFLRRDDIFEGLRVVAIRAHELVLQKDNTTYNLVL